MKQFADKKRSERVFSVRDKVYLKLRQAQLKTISPHKVNKLNPKFYDPYEVFEQVGKAAYKL